MTMAQWIVVPEAFFDDPELFATWAKRAHALVPPKKSSAPKRAKGSGEKADPPRRAKGREKAAPPKPVKARAAKRAKGSPSVAPRRNR